jgi:hypothetical protein
MEERNTYPLRGTKHSWNWYVLPQVIHYYHLAYLDVMQGAWAKIYSKIEITEGYVIYAQFVSK